MLIAASWGGQLGGPANGNSALVAAASAGCVGWPLFDIGGEQKNVGHRVRSTSCYWDATDNAVFSPLQMTYCAP